MQQLRLVVCADEHPLMHSGGSRCLERLRSDRRNRLYHLLPILPNDDPLPALAKRPEHPLRLLPIVLAHNTRLVPRGEHHAVRTDVDGYSLGEELIEVEVDEERGRWARGDAVV